MTDRELLISYQQNRSSADFSQLISKHIDLVYSVARRTARNEHLAEDITQEVFLTLSRKAQTLNPDVPLAGWLFTTTRLHALQWLRAASRRDRREAEVAMSREPLETADPLWPLIAEEIDQAIGELSATDRDAILLRYFNHQSAMEIAAVLAISEEAAKKRVQRALSSLESLLTSRGFATSTALALGATLTTHAVHAAPTTLATTLTAKSAAIIATKEALIGTAKLKVLMSVVAVLALIAIPTTIYLSGSTISSALVFDPIDQPPPPIAPDADVSAYAIPPSHALIALPDLDPAVRSTLCFRGQVPSISRLPKYFSVEWSNGHAVFWRTGAPDGHSLDELLALLIDVYSPEIVSPLLLPRIKADIAFREEATNEQYLADLQKILSDYFKRPIVCSFETRALPTVVLSGNYELTPIPEAPLDRDGKAAISLFIQKRDPRAPYYGFGAINPRQALGRLSQYIDEPIVSDAQGLPTLLPFANNSDIETRQPFSPKDKTLLLEHLAQQTGLTITHEIRPIRCLVINPVDPRIPAPEWQGYPKASPFQAIRWNNDLPEVKYNNTWSQLLFVCNIPIEKIITFAKLSDPKDWQRRFEEDFIALFALMGYPMNEPFFPTLTLKNLSTGKTSTQMVRSTEENRDAIHKALVARETSR